jgi:hypothetical protein
MLVEDVILISKFNWNEFTLGLVMDNCRNARRGIYIRQWPKGNLGLVPVNL